MGREKFKVYINVYIKRISGLEKLEGRYVYIAWTRGGKIGQSSKQTGLTRKALVRDGVAIFDEHIEFAGTLIQNHKGGFNHKFFTLCLNEFVSSESKKKPFTLKYKMNITEYIKKINENLTANVPMSSEVSLQVVVSSKLISSRVTDWSDSEDENEDDNANANNNGEEEEEEEEGEEDSEGDNAGDEGKEKSKGDDETTKKKKKGKKDGGTKKSKKGDKKKKKKSKGSKKKKGGNNSDNDDDDDDDDGNNNNSDDDMNGDGDNTGSGGTDTLSFGGIYPGFGDFTSPFNEKDNQALIESLKREVDVLKKENKEQEQHIAELKTKTDNLKLLQQSKTTDMDESIVQFKRKEEEAAAAASAANTPQKGRRLVRQVGTMNLMSKTPRKSQASLSLSDSLSGPIQSPSPSSPLTNSSAGDEGSEVEELKDLIKFINTEIYMVQPQVLNGNVPVSSSVIFDKLMNCNALRKDDPQKVLSKVLYSIDCALVSCEGNFERTTYWLSTFCSILVLVRKLLSDETLDKDDRLTRHEIGFECFSLRLKTAYSDVIRTVLFDVRRSFVSVLVKSGEESLESTTPSLRKAQAPRPFSAMKELIITPLQQSLDTLKANAVPQSVIVQIFTQVCYTMCAVVFNYVMRHREVNTADMGFRIKLELAKFRDWLHRAGVGEAYEALTPLEEATIVMVTEKSIFADPTIISSICPSLSLAQVRIILSGFGDQVPQDVLFRLKSQSASEDAEEMDETFVNRISYDFL